ncbi:MAG: ATP cone domain-containing protein [Vicingaceae bacterium]
MNSIAKTFVKKSSGDIVPFEQEKLIASLRRSGASQALIEEVLKEVEAILVDGVSTKEIYKSAFSVLKRRAKHTAAKYKLKKAILELGPSGYPFEKFVAEILKYQGFKTQTGVWVKGHCISHEVDVIAELDHQHFMVECKFHITFSRHCDVKVPLYINSRFKDIEKEYQKREEHRQKFHQGWIFTNTRFTSDAIQYGKCAGLQLIGWDFPKSGSLKERIDLAGLHPITCLSSMSKKEIQLLLEKQVVLCRQLKQNPKSLDSLGISERKKKAILKEVQDICELKQ